MGLFSNGVLIRSQPPPGGERLVDGRHDREVVLELIKVSLGASHHAVERVNEFRVVLTKTQLIDHVREIEGLMIDVLPGIPVTVSLRSDMEIPLHPIHVHAPIDPTAVPVSALRPRGFAELALPCLLQNFIDMILATANLDEPVRARVVEGGRVFLEKVRSEDAVRGGILDVNVERVAVHSDRDVEVDLHLVADAWFDKEVLFFMAREM